ncbi:hypothetical protein ABT095_15835 [Kitasatospora sp. NPDC002227]|uniref:hypothetical protein n=1 Tax=Kitasatospora sp. NPDC002227 TaxID=3154773 RepID=UPI00331C95DB
MTITGPPVLTFAVADVFVAGPVVATLDGTGRFSVVLPATDAPDMNPSNWAYVVKENLSGVIGSRTFAALLPKVNPLVELADIAPADPTTPNYVPVPGPKGDPGSVDTVNGHKGPYVYVSAEDVGALPIGGGVLTGGLVLANDAGSYRSLTYRTGTKPRWVLQTSAAAETGADAGSHFELVSWTDAGDYKATLLHAHRDTSALGVGTSSLATGAQLTSAGPAALVDSAAPPPAFAGGSVLYSQAGELRMRKASGGTFSLGRGIADSTLATGLYVGQYRDGQFGPERWNGAQWIAVGAYQAYTCQWSGVTTAPSLGNGSITSRYSQIGKTVTGFIKINSGTSTTWGTGAWFWSLPVPAAAWYFSGYGAVIGSAHADRAAGAGAGPSHVWISAASTIQAFTTAANAPWGATVPWTPTSATGNTYSLNFTYEAA